MILKNPLKKIMSTFKIMLKIFKNMIIYLFTS